VLNDFTVVVAHSQVEGRGQQGNSWESEANKNLTFSLLIHPTFIKIQDQFIISQWVSIAIIKTLAKYIPQGLRIKWPNDIYVNDNKLAGILIENSIMGAHLEQSIIGIGININQKEFRSDAPNPVSLIQIINRHTDLKQLTNELFNTFTEEYKQLQKNQTQLINTFYLRNLYRHDGTYYPYKDENGLFEAQIQGIDQYGRLKLLHRNGTSKIYEFKEVEYIK
jgi:BirA family biotin operon repressor/biotin-[acetyl-CoA-carboxylase] ligase